LRSELDAIAGTSKSLMPDGLEQQMNPQDIADVIAYLLAVVGKR
jgi:mono/diheme cytochrome c family protein